MNCLLFSCVGLSKLLDESNVLLEDSLSLGGDADLMYDGRDSISFLGEYLIPDTDIRRKPGDIRNTTRPRWSVSMEGERGLDAARNRSEKIATNEGLSLSESRLEERGEAKAREVEPGASDARAKEDAKARGAHVKGKAEEGKKASEAAAGSVGARLKAMLKVRAAHMAGQSAEWYL